ncbi:hypothetical protein SNE40_009043 [Patella caerulea]|uniref:RRM domain-containing protein n=1 Tax=Patella caerulea TaxID=87958 RepID=A0AAN8JU80_PATCE
MSTKIFIGNLSHEAQEDDLRPIFEKYGSVSECAVLSSYGFVHMDDEEEAKSAIEGLNGYNIRGLRIRVEISHGKKGDGSKRGRGGGGFRGGRGRGGPRGGGGRDRGGPSRPSPYDRYPAPSSSYYDRYDPYSRYPYPERDYYRPLPPRDPYRVPPTDRYSAPPRERYPERSLPERYPSPYERERIPTRDARSAYPAERIYERTPVERDPYYGRERAASDYYRQEVDPPPHGGINGAAANNGYDSYRPLRSSGGSGYGEESGRAYGRGTPGNSQSDLQTDPIFF